MRDKSPATMTTSNAYISPRPAITRIRRFLSRNRIRISLIAVCWLIATDMLRGSHPHSAINLFDAWSAIGLQLIVVGTCIRSWAAGILTKNRDLSTTGPYAFTRNPLYLGSFLMMIGFCTIIGALRDFIAMLLLALLLYWPKIKSEEAYLQQKFGQLWSEYRQSTPRLLPRRITVLAGACRMVIHPMETKQGAHNSYRGGSGIDRIPNMV